MGVSGGGDGGHTAWARGGQQGVRARICAAGKALEGHDRQTHKQIYGNYRIDLDDFKEVCDPRYVISAAAVLIVSDIY